MKTLNILKKANLIVLGGTDGSGKTTLAKVIASFFIMKGMKVKIVRIRGTHTVAYLLLIILKRFSNLKGKGLHYYNIMIPDKLKGLWIIIELLSVSILLILYFHVYKLIYSVVISERGPLDFLVWVITGVRPSLRKIITKIFLKITTTWIIRYHTIYIRADKATLFERKPSEACLISTMYPVYEILAKSLNLPIIDTTSASPINACQNILFMIYKS